MEELVDDEFYNTPAPSENIWKKFDLLPTPPRSPSRDHHPYLEKNLGLDVDEGKQNLPDVFTLEDNADDIEGYLGFINPCRIRTGLKNELLHDCMWSGNCTENCKQKSIDSEIDFHSDTEQLVVPHADAVSSRLVVPSAASAVPAKSTSPQTGSSPNCKVDLPTVEVVAKDCVDPSSVLPYSPFSDHCYHQPTRLEVGSCCADHKGASPLRRQQYLRDHVGNDTPSDSDEDLDVVSLSQRRRESQQLRRPGRRKGCRLAFRFRKPDVAVPKQTPLKKRTGKRHLELSEEDLPGIPEAERKWMFESSSSDEMKLHVSGKMSCSSSRSSSDSEDTEKRSQHNSMERKRRDDLRFSFQRLREYVPELRENPKAPKVMILNKAATYCKQLTSAGLSLERTVRLENRRRAELQKRLLQLQPSC